MRSFGTGGGAFRWPSGSTLVRIDGPPSLRAVHSPLLTGGPARSLQARPTVRNIGVQATVGQFETSLRVRRPRDYKTNEAWL